MTLGAQAGQSHTMTVTVGIAISSAKAAKVLEQYGAEKERRRLYMRAYRKQPQAPGGKQKSNGSGA